MCRTGFAVWALAWVLLAGTGLRAQEALAPDRLDPSLKGLAFGATSDQVVVFLKARVAAQYDAAIRDTRDVRERDRLTHEMQQRMAEAGTGLVAFEGGRTGWDVSVIRGEFAHGTGETLLDVREGKSHLYLFFTKGIFYKLIRTGVDRPVADWLADLQRAYGAPASVEYHDPKAKSGVRKALWDAGLIALALEDRTRLYQCATLTWVLKTADEAVRAEWKRTGAAADGLNPLVKESQSPIPEDAVDPVDAMIGARSVDRPKLAPSPKAKKKAKPVEGK